ncbi:Rv1355c family protein [Rugosimonospora acidiphila]|uniref:Rv1355c family protein n=1 Tax=Rugosimonospora acidiphila TaxID=556531 RepID=UPI0031EE79D6
MDAGSGLRFECHYPAERPDLWRAYLDGAQARYRHHGVEQALDRPSIEHGEGVTVFWLAFEGEQAVAGVRCHGPVQSVDDVHALVELQGAGPLDELRALIESRLASGVLESKGAWVARGHRCAADLSAALGRCTVHSMRWFGAEFAMATVADHALARWSASGGRVYDGSAPVEYPDDRYKTVLMWWELARVGELAEPGQLSRLAPETAQLWASSRPTRLSTRPAGIPSEEAVWEPEVLDPGEPMDAQRIRELLDDPAVDVRDSLIDQLRELRQLVPPVGADLESETPRWVYFGWRRVLLRIVGPLSFRRIRLDRNRNKITTEEQDRLGRLRIGVVGLSVGHAIAHTLAHEGLCGELRLADFDRIELSNLNRIPASTLDLGLNKAVVAARRITELDPYLKVSVLPDGVSAENLDAFVAGLDLLVEECDSLDVKLLVREACRRRGIPVLMETSDRGMLDVERFDLEPDRPLFHGLLGDVTAQRLSGLSTRDKVPYLLRILEPNQLSARGAASMAEVGHTVTTWPQLGSDVTFGAAAIAAAVRRFGRREPLPSGRLRFDLEDNLVRLGMPLAEPFIVDSAWPGLPSPPTDFIETVAHAAGLAPSGGNQQPWRFETNGDEFRIFLARERTSRMDVQFRGSYVAIGAALFNVRVTASMHGRLGSVELLPASGSPDHIATLSFGDGVDPPLAELYPQVLSRSTNRQAGRPSPLEESTIAVLRGAADREGARLRLIADRNDLEQCAQLLAESDRLRFLSPQLHRDMMSELRWPGRDPLETGIDVRTLELDDSELRKIAMAGRSDIMAHLASWGGGRSLGDMTRDRVRASAGLAIVTVTGSDPASYLRGGAAVQRVWLHAHKMGLAVQPISPVCLFAVDHDDFVGLVPPTLVEPLKSLAAAFRDVTGVPTEESFALVLRVSHAPAPSGRSTRLKLSDLLTMPQKAPFSDRH